MINIIYNIKKIALFKINKVNGVKLLYTEPNELKNILSKLKKDNFTNLSDIDIDKLIYGMLKNIGSTDPDLRDNLIYESFYYLSLKTNVLNDKFRDILQVCLDKNHLFFKIGEKGTDSVFTRTFSVLIIPLIIFNHRKKNIFSKAEIKETFFNVKRYFIEEQI